MTHWIISYGTLMSKKVTEKTGNSFRYIPAYLDGWKREWSFPAPHYRQTAAGIRQVAGEFSTVKLVEIDPKELPAFDWRETGYSRVQIKDHSTIRRMDEQSLEEGAYWLYVPKSPTSPTDIHPICQSMVDVMCAASLEVGEQFAKQFIASTIGWEHPWVNDRSEPRYPRFLSGLPLRTIDALLADAIPDAFASRINL